MFLLFAPLRRLFYRCLPLSWLKAERAELFIWKEEIRETHPAGRERDELMAHASACLEDTLNELRRRGVWAS